MAKPKLKKTAKVVDKQEISIDKEENTFKAGDITKEGIIIEAILDKGRVLVSDKSGSRVVKASDLK